MTEHLGRRARWTAALLVAPGAAALFGASVDWAATAKPATAAKPAQQVLPAATGQSAREAQAAQRMYRTALAHQRGAAALEKTLATLNRKLARMIAADNAAAAATAPTAGYPGNQTAQAGAPGPVPAGPVSVLPPPPAAAPAPPVQVVTGASGVKK
ncbi:MAG: hypothetical protein M3Y44_04810 [Actinomycetota bacterium]|nr:hypothetical protein [Actinomycetota bacterium]